MRPILTDECLDGRLVRALRAQGLDVVSSRDLVPSAPDEEIAALALRLSRVLVTYDRGFGPLIPLLPSEHPGILVVPERTPPFDEIVAWVRSVLPLCAGGLAAFGRESLQRFGTRWDRVSLNDNGAGEP